VPPKSKNKRYLLVLVQKKKKKNAQGPEFNPQNCKNKAKQIHSSQVLQKVLGLSW
jgi:hypothetical protein